MLFALKESPFLARRFPVLRGEDEAYQCGIYTVRIDNREGGTLRELHLPGQTLPTWAREEQARYCVAEFTELPGRELVVGSHELGEQPGKLQVERAGIRRDFTNPSVHFAYELYVTLSMPLHEYLPVQQMMNAMMAARQVLLGKTAS